MDRGRVELTMCALSAIGVLSNVAQYEHSFLLRIDVWHVSPCAVHQESGGVLIAQQMSSDWSSTTFVNGSTYP